MIDFQRKMRLTRHQKSTDLTRFKNPDDDPRGPYLLADVTSPFERPTLRYEWRGILPPDGRCWRYTKERAEALEASGRVVLTPGGRIALKRYLSEVMAETDLEPVPPVRSKLELIVRVAMRAIAVAVAEDPSRLQDVEWRDLERMLREVFEKLGFVTTLTRPSKDGGFDLELKYSDNEQERIVLVEIKHWMGSRKRPGKPIFRSLVDVVARAKSPATGLLLSSTGFTSDLISGRTEIEQRMVRLGGEAKIVSLCQSYVLNENGIWFPTTDLATMLMSGTL